MLSTGTREQEVCNPHDLRRTYARIMYDLGNVSRRHRNQFIPLRANSLDELV